MHGVPARRQSQAGFTLTELLVATAIFVILMSALVTLFNSAIAAVRQGYASIDAFETGRMAMSTFARDLNGAFTAREHGDTYNFYGRPDGFMFVGALANGQIGRVTYVTHPSLNTPRVRMKVTERWGVIEANLRRQAERIARERGYSGGYPALFADNTIDVVDDFYFYSDFSGTRRYNAGEWVEFDVELELESLIRYEETGAADLDAFNMYVKLDNLGAPISLDWPYVDPIEPANDAATPPATDGNAQQAFLLRALDPTPGDTNYDMREIYRTINRDTLGTGGYLLPSGERMFLRALGHDTFQQLLNARKREFWLRMLSGEPMGLPTLTPDASHGSVGYWYDERLNAPNSRNMRVLNEYVIADGIVGRSILLQPNSEIELYIDVDGNSNPSPPDIFPDILDAEVKFAYGDGSNPAQQYFNDIQNLRDPENPDGNTGGANPALYEPSIPILLSKDNGYFGVGDFTDGDLVAADMALSNTMLGSNTKVDPANPSQRIPNAAKMGSPLAPRIPSVVSTDFWVTRTRTRPGAPDILKRFSQTVQIPTAQGRSATTTIAQGPGASL
ncbi:MAG: prepilin-type N-terminal cleavage/methylation domain-containing protein [Candidatus Hydrogenedentes bacterium]|nr:prepilin-type N-terminal cleavage/methylation domain-containing protein [Candidatus Hydrogenedentota bacterium]